MKTNLIIMTGNERMERNETILQGKDPGPTKLWCWYVNNCKEHVLRLACGLTWVGLIACVVYFFATHTALIPWIAVPAAVLVVSYELGAIIRAY